MLFKELNTKLSVSLLMLVVWFLLSVVNHVVWLMDNGWMSDAYQTTMIHKLFWDLPIVIEPVVLLLLFLKPRTGLKLALVMLMVSSIHNFSYYFEGMFFHFYSWSGFIEAYWMLFVQLGFMLFIAYRTKSIWWNRR